MPADWWFSGLDSFLIRLNRSNLEDAGNTNPPRLESYYQIVVERPHLQISQGD